MDRGPWRVSSISSTKEGDDVDGLQLTARGGSFDTFEGSALFGKNINGLEVAAYVDYRTTDGFQGHVDRDRQSVLDERFGYPRIPGDRGA